MNKSCLERSRGDERSDYFTTDVANKVRARVKKMENNVIKYIMKIAEKLVGNQECIAIIQFV